MPGADAGKDWPYYGGTDSETHASTLDQINQSNIGRLGLVAAVPLSDAAGGGSVPVAVDGVVYATVGQAEVHAVDAASGKQLWSFDPKVAEVAGKKLRFAWGSRGLVYSNGRLFIGTLDGRLIAIDAKTGEQVWSTQTTMGPDDGRYITGAPRVFGGLVIIGHGGADFNNARGYVTAYDAATGAQRWRFFIVPGDPANGFEDEAQAMAAKTWTGRWWERGGGGNAWNSITYDAEQDLVYIGTGNGGPINQKVRSLDGGDNLFLCSIVALEAKTGKYRWHYQINPGDTWDYNAAMDITLADLKIDGKPRKVILHAPKNGFFYVLDRTNGKLISADKFAAVNWASAIDLKTGRPIENPEARFKDKPFTGWPGPVGAHSWTPMSFSRRTGLVYIPTIEAAFRYDDTGIDAVNWKPRQNLPNTGLNLANAEPAGPLPEEMGTSYLQAWDPVAKKRVWKVPTPGLWNGGTMVTAGDLVFQGQGDGHLVAYAAQTGKKLWSYDTGFGISGAPITFSAGGKQYVAVVSGWGNSGAFVGHVGWQARTHRHMLFVFALDGKAAAPERARIEPLVLLKDESFRIDPAAAARGAKVYADAGCTLCHGPAAVSGGYAPDLRASPVVADAQAFRAVLQDGALVPRGMPAYPEFGEGQREDLRHFFRARAREEGQ